MDTFARIQKPRSKSSVRISPNKFNKRTETNETLDKDTPKVQSYMRVYGHLPTVKRIKSTRDCKTFISSIKLTSTPKSAIIQQTSTNFKTEPNVNRHNEAKSNKEKLIYDILKAQSDTLEIARDIATYEYNSLLGINFTQKIAKIKKSAYSFIKDFGENNKSNSLRILSDINDIFRPPTDNYLQRRQSILSEIHCKEDFEVRACIKPAKAEEYAGISSISSENCVIRVTTKLFSVHTIRCLLLSGKTIQLTFHKDIAEEVKNLGSFKEVLEKHIFPCLYIMIFGDDLKLIYDENHGSSFITLVVRLKGIRDMVTVIIKDAGDSLRFELGNTFFYKIVDKLSLECRDIMN